MLGGGPDHDPEPKPETGWLVDNDFTVVTVEEFDKKHSAFMSPYGPIPLNPRMARMSKTIYKTRVNAEKGARKACEQAVEKARADLLTLKNILKVVRPWEKK
jgi:hypothetical protein